jgi:hypothetical protein
MNTIKKAIIAGAIFTGAVSSVQANGYPYLVVETAPDALFAFVQQTVICG